MKMDMVVKRGADLLIFCVDIRAEECQDVKRQWKHFNLTYGGDLSPQIIIIIGATDQRSAEKWWKDAVGAVVTQPGDGSIACLPISESFDEVEAVKGRLRHLVNTHCIDCSKANLAGGKRIFKFKRHADTLPGPAHKSSIASLWRPPAKSGTVDEMDVLTKWGVWEHLSTERDALTY